MEDETHGKQKLFQNVRSIKTTHRQRQRMSSGAHNLQLGEPEAPKDLRKDSWDTALHSFHTLSLPAYGTPLVLLWPAVKGYIYIYIHIYMYILETQGGDVYMLTDPTKSISPAFLYNNPFSKTTTSRCHRYPHGAARIIFGHTVKSGPLPFVRLKLYGVVKYLRFHSTIYGVAEILWIRIN